MNALTQLPVLSPALLGILSAAAVGLLLVFFWSLYRREQSLANYDVRKSLEGKSNKWIEKRANEMVRMEAFRIAGDLRAHLEQWEDAAELYKKGGNYIRAAECHIASGNSASAALAYIGSQNYERAASLFKENGDYHRAAEAYLKADDPMRAARTFEQGGAFEQAAEIYLEQGLYRRAARMYEKKENWSRAADALWRCFGQERARLTEELSDLASMPLKVLARQSGDMFREAGRFEEAIEAYQAGRWLQEKALALEEAGRYLEAAQTYLETEDVLKAAHCYEQAGEDRKAAGLQAEHHLSEGNEREAISYLEAAGEYFKAAEIYKKFEEWARAGENFQEAKDYREAARMYEQEEDFEKAANALEQEGDFAAAANFYIRAGNPAAQAEALEKAGDFIGAGSNHFERGLLDRAIAVLQKVELNAPEYATASLLLGQVFREKGMHDLAIEYFKRSIEGRELSRGNLENFYQLAVCAEGMEDVDEAAAIFEKIVVVDFHYKDVADRLNAIRSSRTQVETPSTPDQEATVGRPVGQLMESAAVSQSQRYTLLEEIGRGGMGIVYKATDNVLEREVAFKMLPSDLKEHPQALKNFFREAKSAARLNHPNIVTVFDAGEEGGTYYIAMEYIEGETIKQILNREVKLPIKAVLVIAGQVCKSLEYAHSRRIVHRDIKSSNIMWTPDKQVKLMDFGLAKVIEKVKGYQTIASGTPYYMSPEQTLGRNIDHRTDLYSLGITIFEMATGKLPFMHGDAAYHHVHTAAPEAKSISADVPDTLSRIVSRCMEKNPDDRFQDAKELFNALRKVV